MKFSFLVLFGLFSYCTCEAEQVYEYVDETAVPELEYLNRDVDPCENFYEYTCGNFKNVHQKPEGLQIWDQFAILQDEIHQLLRVILESDRKISDPVALQKAKAAYASCVDVEYTDQLDLPERRVMAELGTWPVLDSSIHIKDFSWNQIGDIVSQYGVPLFFNYQVIPSYFNATENVIYMYRDALSNPATVRGSLDKNYEEYLTHPAKLSKSAEPLPFEVFLRTIAFRLRNALGTFKTDSKIIDEIAETIDFMRILQSGGIVGDDDVVEPLSSTATIEQLQSWTDDHFGKDYELNWLEYFNRLFRASGVTVTKDMRIFHSGVNLIYGVLNLVRQTDPRVLKNLVMVRLFTHMAPDSDSYMREAFDAYYRAQNYDVFPRWQYCLRKILGYPSNVDFSMALTYEYQRYHFNVNKLEAAAEMIADLQDSFQDILHDVEWIDETTREKALKKAENMITLLGYPNYAEDRDLLDEFYDDLRVCTWDHFGNSQRARSFRQAINFAQLGVPRNRELWNLSPLEVNAFYNRANNRILFPVSVLNPVFFGGNISSLDYGRIGAIIGHEITHGFDDEGRKYNELGNLANWWTDETLAAFQERTQCFIDQYSKYLIEEIGVYVDAEKTLNENLADNGGLREAYRAFKKLEERTRPMRTISDFTPEQLFFIGFGTMWCMTETPYYLEQMHLKNVYSPGRFRVIGSVSNMEEFAKAFSCPVGSNMNPEDKCVLW